MNKILVISYFYPPANFVGADRPSGWIRHFNKSDIYPIVITRNWNPGQTDTFSKVLDNNLKIEYNQNHEIHRLPYKRSIRDRLIGSSIVFRPIQKLLTLFEIVFSKLTIRAPAI